MASYPRLRHLLWGGLVLVALLVILAQGKALFDAIRAGAATSSDFCQDYQTASHWLNGTRIYAAATCWSLYSSTSQPLEYDTHLPPSLLLFAPFALTSYSLAAWLWGIVNLACLILSVVMVCQEMRLWSLRRIVVVLALFLLWNPTLESTRSGNVGAGLSCLLVVLVWRSLRRGQQAQAGTLTGAAILLKPLPFLFLPYFLLRRQWRAAAWASGTLVLGSIVSLALMGPQTWGDYLGPVRADEDFVVPVPGNLSLAGLVTRWSAGYHEFLHPGVGRAFVDLPPLFPPISLTTALLLGNLLAGLVALACGFWLYQHSVTGAWDEGDDASFAFVLVLSFLVFPLAWHWNLVLLAMPLLWLAVRVQHRAGATATWRLKSRLEAAPQSHPARAETRTPFFDRRSSRSAWLTGVALILLAMPFSWFIPAFQFQAQISSPWRLRLAAALFTALPTIALILLLAALALWCKRTPAPVSKRSSNRSRRVPGG